MKRALFVLFSILSALVLVGCHTNPVVEVRETTVVKFILPPDDLIKACIPDPPSFTADEYVTLDDSAKEAAMVKYANGLLGTTIICNERIDGLRTWKLQKLDDQRKEDEAREKAKQQ